MLTLQKLLDDESNISGSELNVSTLNAVTLHKELTKAISNIGTWHLHFE